MGETNACEECGARRGREGRLGGGAKEYWGCGRGGLGVRVGEENSKIPTQLQIGFKLSANIALFVCSFRCAFYLVAELPQYVQYRTTVPTPCFDASCRMQQTVHVIYRTGFLCRYLFVGAKGASLHVRHHVLVQEVQVCMFTFE